MISQKKKPPVRHRLSFAGYEFTSDPKGTVVAREYVNTRAAGDYGADPIGDGTFRMIPSGDIVSFEERNHRLQKATRREGETEKEREILRKMGIK